MVWFFDVEQDSRLALIAGDAILLWETRAKMSDAADPARDRVLVFIPCYNDNATVAATARAALALGPQYRVLVVDDGSRRPIERSALGDGALLCRLPDNYGIGVATHIAIDHALAHDYRCLVRVDADGQHPIDQVPRLVAATEGGAADIVAGVRLNRHDGGGDRRLRNGVTAYYAAVARLLTGGRAPSDVNTGFFVLGRNAMGVVNDIDLERFPEPQMFVTAARAGLRIADIGIEQEPRRHGESTLRILPALRMFFRFHIFVLNELLTRHDR